MGHFELGFASTCDNYQLESSNDDYHNIIPFDSLLVQVRQSLSVVSSKRIVAYNTYKMAFLMFGVKETRKSINSVHFLFFGSETP